MVFKLERKLERKLKKQLMQLTHTGNIDCPAFLIPHTFKRESDLGESLKSTQIRDSKKNCSV